MASRRIYGQPDIGGTISAVFLSVFSKKFPPSGYNMQSPLLPEEKRGEVISYYLIILLVPVWIILLLKVAHRINKIHPI